MTKSKLQETINQHGGNLKPVLDAIKEAQKKVLELQTKREPISAEIGEVRASVKALGFSKKSFDNAVVRSQMDPEKRDQYDEDFSIACEAMGCPITGEQAALFETEEGDKDDGTSEEEDSTGEQQADAISNAA